MVFKLRPYNLDDIESLVKYANNPKIAANLTNQFLNPYGRENGENLDELIYTVRQK